MSHAAVLVPGGRGQVGAELRRLLSASGRDLVHTPGSAELDIADADAVVDAVDSFSESARDSGHRPVVINVAAYTAVDAAETDEERARAVNTTGAGTLARACRARGVPLVHVSTDYVFPGDGSRPYEPEDDTGPRTVYGRTKLDGELEVLESGAQAWVVRTAWVYGFAGKNFVKTMARLESSRPSLSVVDDQRGSPTWAADLAAGLLELADRVAQRQGPKRKVLHCTNPGQVTWFEFARAVFTELGADPQRIEPCSTAEFPLPAPRPAYSVLSDRAWRAEGLSAMRPWRAALAAAFVRDGSHFRGS